jgi:hypothetical protein
MAAGIVYLDVDDEITSAAQRIRSSAATRVALVVPYGSRIATSRMNFRLLSREALVSNRRLSIVSGDAATRALAASAGLPVFGSVGEYEDADERGREAPPSSGAGADEASAEAADDAAVGGAAAAATALAAPPATPPVTTLAESETVAAVGPPAEETTRMAVPVAAPTRPPTRSRPRPRPEPRQAPVVVDRPTDLEDRDEGRGLPRLNVRTPVLAAIAVAALALVVIGVGAYLFLPAATIAVTPRREPITIDLIVAADPEATAVDAANGVVPAVRLDVPVEATQTFTTTGVHVETAASKGEVTFSNYNPVSSNSIAAGSVVSTEGGVRFKTLASVTIPPGTFVLPNVVPSTRRVAVQAVKPGPEGNVPANAIRVVPQGEDPDFLKVNNADPTDGGTRTETPEITKAEVDKALAALQTQLATSFDQAIAAGAGAPQDTTLFPETKNLGVPTPSIDPQSLVGQALPTFDLTLTANGTVIAVDPRPVRAIAETQLNGRIGADHRLVPGSVDVEVGEGTVGEDGQVTFQATARATRVLVVDANQVRALVKGKTQVEAEAALARFGDVRVELWPDWVSTVTAMDARLSVTVDDGATSEGGGAAPSPAASRSPAGQASVAP